MSDKPTIHTEHHPFGDQLTLLFEGEQFDNDKILDTRVSIEGSDLLCFIAWEDRESFLFELSNVLEKYRI